MMRKPIALILKTLIITALLLIGILVYKTLGFNSRQIIVDPVQWNWEHLNENVVSHLAESIRFKTISEKSMFDSLEFKAMLQYVDSVFIDLDKELTKETFNEFSLIYKWPGRNATLKPILLMNHLDVVPVEVASKDKWIEKPFSGTIKDGYVWGRGTLDDKLGVFGILEAVKMLINERFQPERTIYLAFGHDEESSGKNGAKAMVEKFKKEGLKFEFVLDEGNYIIEDAMSGLEQPAALIGIAEKGYTTLTLTAKVEQGGHSSMPPPETAIGILAKAIHKLEENPFPAKIEGAAKSMFDYIGPEMDFTNKTILANQWLFGRLLIKQLSASPSTSAFLRTTTATTMFRAGIKENVLPSSASAKINFRIIPGETVSSVYDHVKNTIDDDRIILTYGENKGNNPTKISSTKSFGFNLIQKTIKELFPNVLIVPTLTIATTDSRYYQGLTDDIYRFLPLMLKKEDLTRIHGMNERIKVEDYKQMIRFYHRLIKNSTKN